MWGQSLAFGKPAKFFSVQESIMIFAKWNSSAYTFYITFICTWKARVTSCVMKLGRYVILDDGGNYVTFHELNGRIKITKLIITPHNESFGRLCSSAKGHPHLFTFSASIFLKSRWHQDSKTLKSAFNFVKLAVHVDIALKQQRWQMKLWNYELWIRIRLTWKCLSACSKDSAAKWCNS